MDATVSVRAAGVVAGIFLVLVGFGRPGLAQQTPGPGGSAGAGQVQASATSYVPDLKAIGDLASQAAAASKHCGAAICVRTDCGRTHALEQHLWLLNSNLYGVQLEITNLKWMVLDRYFQQKEESTHLKGLKAAAEANIFLKRFAHEVGKLALAVLDAKSFFQNYSPTGPKFDVQTDLASQFLNLFDLEETLRVTYAKLGKPLPEWLQKGSTGLQLLNDLKSAVIALNTADKTKGSIAAVQILGKLGLLYSEQEMKEMQKSIEGYGNQLEQGYTALIAAGDPILVSLDLEVRQLQQLAATIDSPMRAVASAARSVSRCLKSCSALAPFRDAPVSLTHGYLQHYKKRADDLRGELARDLADFSAESVDPAAANAPEMCRQLASPSPANPDPMDGLKPPAASFPDLITLPERFCSEYEKGDFDRVVLTPLLSQASRLYREFSHYDSELSIRLQKVDNSLSSMQRDDPSQSLQIESLEGQRNALRKLRDDFEPGWLKAKETQPTFIGLSAAFQKIPVKECGPPMPVNITIPELPETFCSEKDREKFIAAVNAATAELKRLSEARRAYGLELVSRRSITQDQTLKASLTKEIDEGTIVDSATDKTVATLNEMLEKAKALEIANCIDPCLVGAWEARNVKSFAGIRVTFSVDGTETVDYSAAQPQVLGPNDQIVWSGVATAKIETPENKTARIVESGVSNVELRFTVMPAPFDLSDRLGVGGLGGTTGDNAYVCTESTLTYQGTMHRDKSPNFEMNLTRLE